jgi:hypothetical protein
MADEHWQMVQKIFREALSRPGPDRRACLERACGSDRALRMEIESLLAHHELAERTGFARGPDHRVRE